MVFERFTYYAETAMSTSAQAAMSEAPRPDVQAMAGSSVPGHVRSVQHEVDALVACMQSIAERPAADFDREMLARLERIAHMAEECSGERDALLHYCFQRCGRELDSSTVFRHARHKPFGYAGDYLAIDWIYTRRADSPGVGRLWDEFYQRRTAPQAVRNRKDYFCETFGSLLKELGRGPSVLDLASGPCRDVAEALLRTGQETHGSMFHCVDVDARAVAYARRLVNGLAPWADIRWEVANVLRFRPRAQYDLVWSAGLFDYLEDRIAVRLLRRMWRWTAPGGQLVAGNFHVSNPSRHYMEWCGGWFLKHRTDDDMRRLCRMAEIPETSVTIGREALGACILCVACKP